MIYKKNFKFLSLSEKKKKCRMNFLHFFIFFSLSFFWDSLSFFCDYGWFSVFEITLNIAYKNSKSVIIFKIRFFSSWRNFLTHFIWCNFQRYYSHPFSSTFKHCTCRNKILIIKYKKHIQRFHSMYLDIFE